MVTGFTKFKEKFQGFEDQYVVIGGTACDLLMENEDMTFRATKDVDIVLIVESITAEFGNILKKRSMNIKIKVQVIHSFIVLHFRKAKSILL